MNLSFVQIRAQLKPYIQSFWVFESPVGMPPTEANLAAPNGCPKLIIPCENSITSIANGQVQQSYEQGLYFVGNRDSVTLLHTSPRKTRFIGIEFYPHGAYPIFGIPMVETTNRLLTADMVFSTWGQEFTEIIRNHERLDQKIDCVQNRLTDLLHRRKLQNHIVEFCVASSKSTDGIISIRELERQTGYTRRYLELLFKNHVGLSPKVLAGIFRFQRFYQAWAQRKSFDALKDELYDYYYDQAHFTKEFKRMTGFSPGHFAMGVANEFVRRLSLQQ
jgi:AraC-like DNA-binding protein